MVTPLSIPKTLVRLSLCIGSCVALVNCNSLVTDHQPTEPAPTTQRQVQHAVDSIRHALQKELNDSVPSLNVYIQTPKHTVFASSVPRGTLSLTDNTNFRFASNTKMFTSTAILKMHQDGWLNFKARISAYIPGTTLPYVPNTTEWDFPYKNDITIEQLLQHAAGVYDVDNDSIPGTGNESYTAYTQGIDPTHQFTADELVKPLVWYKLFYFAPGTGSHYSNTGYTILGYIIARVYSARSNSPKTYEDYLQDHIVGPNAKVPLAMRFPVLASDTKMPFPYAIGTERLPGGKINLFGDYNMSAQVAEGNGYSSPASLNTFVRTLMKGENVLTPGTIQVMQNDTNRYSSNRYALGCFYTPNLGYGHNGERCGTLSLATYDPVTDVSVVAFITLVDKTRGGETQGGTFYKCFSSIYSAAITGKSILLNPKK